MTTSKLSHLNKVRGRVQTKLTAFSNFLERTATDVRKLAELPSQIEKAEQLWLEFDVV